MSRAQLSFIQRPENYSHRMNLNWDSRRQKLSCFMMTFCKSRLVQVMIQINLQILSETSEVGNRFDRNIVTKETMCESKYDWSATGTEQEEKHCMSI